VSPTLIALDASDTVTVEMRLASAARSLELILSAPVTLFSEHERIAIIARAVVAPRSIRRFTVTPMNRATYFSPVATERAPRQPAHVEGAALKLWPTGNAAETARIYIRQASHSNRHCVLALSFSEAIAPCFARNSCPTLLSCHNRAVKKIYFVTMT